MAGGRPRRSSQRGRSVRSWWEEDRHERAGSRFARVRYALDKTLAALAEEQRLRFATLGLPDGPAWPLAVIERMLDALPPDASNTAMSDLEVLSACSLVSFETGDDGTQRIRMHRLVRELAREEWGRLSIERQHLALTGLLAGIAGYISAQLSS